MKYTLDYIVKENGRYYAHLRQQDPRGVSKDIHSGVLFGWQGMTYKELREVLKRYNISLPQLKDMEIFKKTQCRTCYRIAI